jgi:hypothetical protein
MGITIWLIIIFYPLTKTLDLSLPLNHSTNSLSDKTRYYQSLDRKEYLETLSALNPKSARCDKNVAKKRVKLSVGFSFHVVATLVAPPQELKHIFKHHVELTKEKV